MHRNVSVNHCTGSLFVFGKATMHTVFPSNSWLLVHPRVTTVGGRAFKDWLHHRSACSLRAVEVSRCDIVERAAASSPSPASDSLCSSQSAPSWQEEMFFCPASLFFYSPCNSSTRGALGSMTLPPPQRVGRSKCWIPSAHWSYWRWAARVFTARVEVVHENTGILLLFFFSLCCIN